MPYRTSSLVAGAVLALLSSLVVVVAGGCAGQPQTAEPVPLIKCTPGNYVFCRCQNRVEGTKLCGEDGASFGKCEPCETDDNPVLPDGPDGPIVVDGGVDSAPPPPPPAVCGDKVVQDGEDCDDGNKVEDDGCDSLCRLAGVNPLPTRSCPGLDTHVWSKPVAYIGTTVGAPNPGSLKMNCKNQPLHTPTSGALGRERIFKVTAHKTGTMTVASSDNGYDSLLYATATSTCTTTNIEYLVCANDFDGRQGETMSFPVTAGASYSVFVDGAGISEPDGVFRVTFSIQ